MTAKWCRRLLEDTINTHGQPCIDSIFIERQWKSIKYECVYLHTFEDGVKPYEGLKKYFNFYNKECFHCKISTKKIAQSVQNLLLLVMRRQ